MGLFFNKNKKELLELPLNLRLDAVIEVSELPFALNAQELITKAPSTSLKVKNIGIIDEEEVRLVRLYLNDLRDESDDVCFIEVGVDKNDHTNIYHTRFFSMDGWLAPDSEEWFEEELPNWIDEDEGMIGDAEFSIEQDEREYDFERIWFSDTDRHVSPAESQEDLYTTTLERHSDSIDHQSMLYGRPVGDDAQEYCFLTYFEGGPMEGGVMIFTGIDLAREDLVIY